MIGSFAENDIENNTIDNTILLFIFHAALNIGNYAPKYIPITEVPYPNQQNEPNSISKPEMVHNSGYPEMVDDEEEDNNEEYFAPIYETTETLDDMPRNLPSLHEYETDFYAPGYVLIKPPSREEVVPEDNEHYNMIEDTQE